MSAPWRGAWRLVRRRRKRRRKCRPDHRNRTLRSPSHGHLGPLVAEVVIGGAPVRIAKAFVGLVDLFEPVRRVVLRVMVGMVLEGQAAERFLYLLVAGVPLYLEDVIIVAFFIHKYVLFAISPLGELPAASAAPYFLAAALPLHQVTRASSGACPASAGPARAR